MSCFFGKKNDVIIYPNLSIVLIIVYKPNIFIAHEITILYKPDKHLDHLRILIYLFVEGICSC